MYYIQNFSVFSALLNAYSSTLWGSGRLAWSVDDGRLVRCMVVLLLEAEARQMSQEAEGYRAFGYSRAFGRFVILHILVCMQMYLVLHVGFLA